MLYVSKIIDDSNVEVTDTVDNVSEVASIADLISMNNQGETIIGIDRDGLWSDYNPETATDLYYSGDKIDTTGNGVPVWICYWDGRIADHRMNQLRCALKSEEYKCLGAKIGLLKGVLSEKDFSDMILMSKDDFERKVMIVNFWEGDEEFYKDNLCAVTPFLTDSNCFEVSSFTRNNFNYAMRTVDGSQDIDLSCCYTFPDYMSCIKHVGLSPSGAGLGTDDRTIFRSDVSEKSSDNEFKTAEIATDLQSRITQSYIHQHFVLKDTGKVLFLVINTDVGARGDREIYSDWKLVDAYTLAREMSGEEAEHMRKLGADEDALIRNGFIHDFYNASFHDNIIEYTNQSGTYRFEIDKYTQVSRNYVDMLSLNRSRTALSLLRREPSHVDERGSVDFLRISDKGVATIPEGAVTMAFNCRFNVGEFAGFDRLNLKEIVFPRTFKRVLDYIGLLKGSFRVMTAGNDGAPVKITVRGEPDEFLKSYIK